MCGRYALKQNLAKICALFGISTSLEGFKPRYNAAPDAKLPIIIKNRLGLGSWGWPVQDGVKPIINIRSETVHEKAMFMRAWNAGQRCLVPTSGFYEWDSSSQPFFVEAPDAPLSAFCGVWSRDWDNDVRFAILTQAALAHLAPIHPRMPVIVTPENGNAWLRGARFPASPTLDVFPVGKGVNVASNDGPELLDRMAAAPQGNLFMA